VSTLLELDNRRAEFWKQRPEPLSHLAFAYTLTLPDSQDENGRMTPYDPTSHPAQWIMLNALDGGYDQPDHKYIKFMFASDAQGGGKSWIMQQCGFRDMVEVGQNVIYALPTRDLGGDIWQLKLRPAITGAGLEGYLPNIGPTSKGGSKPRFVPFVRKNGKGGGTLVFMAAGGRGQSGQAALTARKLLVDEVDDWEQDALMRIGRRVDRYAETAIQFYVSTIKKDDSEHRENDHSNIVDMYEKSTKGRIEYKCPHCPEWTRFEWETFKYEKSARGNAHTACLFCTKCGELISEAERMSCFAFGSFRYSSDNLQSSVFGLRSTALDCPWKTLVLSAERHAAAIADRDKGNHEPMRQFAHDQQVLQYRDDENVDDIATQIDSKYLLRRSEASQWGPTQAYSDRKDNTDLQSYSRHIADHPEGAKWATVAVDVQANRCYWLFMGGGPDGSTWDIAWGYEHATMAREEMTVNDLHGVLTRIDGLTREIAGELPIAKRGVDANFRTDDIVNWLKTRFEWWPLYGASAQKASRMHHKTGDKVADYPGVLYMRRSDGWHLRQHRVHIDTNPMRMEAQRSFLRMIGEPGAAHLPSGLGTNHSDLAYLEHLCGEKFDEKKMRWEKFKGRWDWLDCRTYCMAMHRYHLLTFNKPRPKRIYGNIGTL
jgi:hypothetical protein